MTEAPLTGEVGKRKRHKVSCSFFKLSDRTGNEDSAVKLLGILYVMTLIPAPPAPWHCQWGSRNELCFVKELH